MAKNRLISGKLILFPIFLLSLQINAETRISSDTVRLGEPLEIEIEFKNNERVEVIKRAFEQDGVTANYSGIEQRTTIINMNQSSSKIIKYTVIPHKAGNYHTPDIEIEVNGKVIHTGRFSFKVLNEKYKQQRVSPFSDFFPNMGDSLSEDEVKIKFFTDRNTAYVGESITGYFVLLYNADFSPQFQRDPSGAVSFPFFLSERLQGVGLQIPPHIVFDGREYNALPYSEEIYALTPLKEGNFTLGESTFYIAAGMFANPFKVDAIAQNIFVKKLPMPVRTDFSGEVGDYVISVEIGSAGTNGSGIPLKLIITGEGSGSFFKNPAEKICENKPCQIILNGKSATKKFAKLKNGKHGLTSTSEFHYSVIPNQEGYLELNDLNIIYFNPATGRYVTRNHKFNRIKVSPSIIEEKPKTEESSSENYQSLIWSFVAILFIGLGIFIFRKYVPVDFSTFALPEQVTKSLDRIIKTKKAQYDFTALDKIVGNKKGILLKNYLQEKSIDEKDALEVVSIKTRYAGKSLNEIAQHLSQNEQEKLAKIQKKIIEG